MTSFNAGVYKREDSTGTSRSIPLTINSGANALALLVVGGAGLSNFKWNGVDITITTSTASGWYAYYGVLANPAIGSHNITFDCTDFYALPGVLAVAIDNANIASLLRGTTSVEYLAYFGSSLNRAPSGNIAGDMMLMVYFDNDYFSDPSAAAGTTQVSTTQVRTAGFYKVSTASNDTIGFTITGDTGGAAVASLAIAGAGDTTAPDITSTGTGSTNGPFSVNLAENSIASFITLTSNENVTWGTLGGADATYFQKANPTSTTVELQAVSTFNYEALPHSNPFVVTIPVTDGASNSRTVTVNVTVTDVSGPTVNTHPSNQTVTAPNTATFSVSATGATGYQWQRNPGGNTSFSNVTDGTGGTTSSYTTSGTSVSGGNHNSGDTYRCVVSNAEGSTNSNAATLTVNAGADTTVPTMNGSLNVTSLTPVGYTVSYSPASDNVGVTGYERSLNGGTSYTDVGNVLTFNVSGRTPGSTDQVRVRAYDAAGNRAIALSTNVTLTTTTTVTSVVSNGSGTPLGSTLFHYSFWPGGRIGSCTGITPQEGTVTSGTNGVCVIPNLTPTLGLLQLSYRATSGTSDVTTDKPYYQAVTPS